MKVLLQQRVASLGQPGTIVDVTESYARNFLIPKKLAVPATAAVVLRHEQKKSAAGREQQERSDHASAVFTELSSIYLEIDAPASPSGTLFAALQERDMRGALNRKHHLSLPTKLVLKGLPIKRTGEHQLTLASASGQTGTLNLVVRGV